MTDQTETILVVDVDDFGDDHSKAHHDGVAHYHYSPTGDTDDAVCILEPGPRPLTPYGDVDVWSGWKRTNVDEYLARQDIDAEQFACSCEYYTAIETHIAEARRPKPKAFPFDFASLIPRSGFEATVDSVLVSNFEVNGVEHRVLIPQVQYINVDSVGIFPNLLRRDVDTLPRTELPIHVCMRPEKSTKIEVRAQAPEEGQPFLGYEVTIS